MKCSPNLKSKISNLYSSSRHAFTLVELLVSVGIFAMMTALVVVKYGNFNQSVLLTNLAYDVALTIRTAQTYGLSVKNSATDPNVTNFQSGYGVHFDTSSTLDELTKNKNNQQIILFADTSPSSPDSIFTSADMVISTYAIKRGATIYGICFVPGCSTPNPTQNAADITFKRPDPSAYICINANGTCDASYEYIEITIRGTDGGLRTVIVRSNGQISVKD